MEPQKAPFCIRKWQTRVLAQAIKNCNMFFVYFFQIILYFPGYDCLFFNIFALLDAFLISPEHYGKTKRRRIASESEPDHK